MAIQAVGGGVGFHSSRLSLYASHPACLFLAADVTGIANTMDLPERLLPRIASRVGLQRLPFAPYSREQMEAIVADRLAGGTGRERGGREGEGGAALFAARAIELAARKVRMAQHAQQ